MIKKKYINEYQKEGNFFMFKEIYCDNKELLNYVNSQVSNTKYTQVPDPLTGINLANAKPWLKKYTTLDDDFFKDKHRFQILTIAQRFYKQFWELKRKYENMLKEREKQPKSQQRSKGPQQPKLFRFLHKRVNSMEKMSQNEIKLELSSDFAKVANALDDIGLFKSAQEMRENRQRRILIKDTLTKDVVKALSQDVKLIEGKIRILNTLASGGFASEKDMETAKEELASAINMVHLLHKKMYEIFETSFTGVGQQE